MKTTKRSVFAVVVTFNRPGILRLCLDSLINQVAFGLERIHVIVNSTDLETRSLLQSYQHGNLLSYEFLDNPGPAGGFRVGLEKFLGESQSHVWVMDDDVIVKDDCLKELLLESSKGVYVCPRVIAEDGTRLNSYGWWGVLLDRSVIERVGLPLVDLFYWTEDTEYLQHRIQRVHKIMPIQCKTAVISHLHQRSQKRPSWYYYYVIRNTIYYRSYILRFKWSHLKRTLFLICNAIFRILTKEEKKARKFGLMVYGIYHGVIGKIGRLVDPGKNK